MARALLAGFVVAAAMAFGGHIVTDAQTPSRNLPEFEVDKAWPKVPPQWKLGDASSFAIDDKDNVWLLHRPRTVKVGETPAPPVVVFDTTGKFIKAWGGEDVGTQWPQREHGIHVDAKGFVWLTGNGDNDGQILKFTQDGKFVLQIGKVGPQTGSADTTRLGRPAGVEVEAAANEIYVADGYHNRRVIVFDADTGAYKRHWGAFGRPPSDAVKPESRRALPPTPAQLEQFGTPVHCVKIARDGMVYVCDRLNNRVQVFRKDGGFVKEFMVEPRTASNGSVWDIVLSRDPQQKWLHLADGRNNHVLTLERETGVVVQTLGRSGRYAGEFHWVHDLAIDSLGNLYAGEVDNGKRVQKFTRK